MRAALIALSLASLTACATSAISPEEASPVPAERIASARYADPAAGAVPCMFIRDSGLYGAGVTIELYIDGERVAGFRPSERLRLYLPEGDHLMGSRSSPNFGLEEFVEHRERVRAEQACNYRLGVDYTRAIVQPTSNFH